MDKLGLTNFFLIETGVGDPTQTLVDADDDILQAAHWIDTSWASFQRERMWPFRWAENSLVIVPGTTAYTAAARQHTLGDLIVPDSFYASAGSIKHVSYEELRTLRRSGSSVDTSRVTHVAVKDGTIYTYPDIAANQTIEFDRWRAVQSLENNTDVPYGLPSDFHALIGHLAIARHGVVSGGDEGANLYQHHAREYLKVLDEYRMFAGITESFSVPATRGTLLGK